MNLGIVLSRHYELGIHEYRHSELGIHELGIRELGIMLLSLLGAQNPLGPESLKLTENYKYHWSRGEGLTSFFT